MIKFPPFWLFAFLTHPSLQKETYKEKKNKNLCEKQIAPQNIFLPWKFAKGDKSQ